MHLVHRPWNLIDSYPRRAATEILGSADSTVYVEVRASYTVDRIIAARDGRSTRTALLGHIVEQLRHTCVKDLGIAATIDDRR